MIPRISVIVPNFNHGEFLEKRIQTILRQSRTDFELILLDDHSSDQSLDILARYAQDPHCRLLVNERNSGNPFKQWNKGVEVAKGDFIWIAESDDYASEFILEKLASRLEQHPQAGLAYCQSWVVDEKEQQLGLNDAWTRALDPGRWQKDFYADGREECRNFLVFQNTIPNASAVLFRKDIYERIGRADETFFYAGDWHVWVRMLAVSDICFCSEPLNFYRTHAATVRKKALAGTRRVAENYRILDWLLIHMNIPADSAEKALDLAMDRWQRALTARAGNLSPARNRDIFHVARRIDNRLYRRFSRHFLAGLKRKLKRPAQLA